MNPLWAIFFKDRFKNPFSMYKMSFAEIVFLLALLGGIGYGISEGVKYILDFEDAETTEQE